MRGSSSRGTATAARPSRYSRPQVCGLRPSDDLAGRTVKLSADVPDGFDVPLAPHHKKIGRWVALRAESAWRYTRQGARALIEKAFGAAVLEILKPIELADLRVVVLHGDDELPPALAVICDSIGQLDLGWIEKANVLSNTLSGSVAPVSWRATAYKALAETLCCTIPVIGYDDLFEEMSMSYWDGATEDEDARRALVEYDGADPGEIEDMLPSAMNARRPDFMLAENVAPLKHLPAALSDKLRALRQAHKAVRSIGEVGNAWHFDSDQLYAYVPGAEDNSWLPPMTLVPADEFVRELDDVCRHGMETGFQDVAGLCPLPDPEKVDAWFASLKLGAEFLLAAQDLINADPGKF